jgi:F0F1-type ATP synthase delta subunit
MKYSPEIYARVLLRAISSAEIDAHDGIIKRFGEMLRKSGDDRYADKIYNAIQSANVKNRGGRNIVVEFAREQSEGVRKNFASKFSPIDRIQYRINKSIVAGARITIDGQSQYDGSFKKKLTKLFGNINS